MKIIFDWSGTLANDQKLTWRVTNKTLEYFSQKPVSYKDYGRDFTIPVSGFYNKYCPDVSIKKIDEVFFEILKQSVSEIQLFPNMDSLLKKYSIKHSLYILSTLPTNILKAALKAQKLTPYFSGVYGNAFHKTKILNSLIHENQLEKNETLFIGDMPHDIEAARDCRVPSAGVTWGYSSEKVIDKQRPDYIFRTVNDIEKHIQKTGQTEQNLWPLVTVGGFIFGEEGKALLVKTEKWSGLWGTPGGKVDYGESLEQAFAREIKEETNLAIKDIQFVFYQDCIEHPQFYRPAHFLLMNYIARVDSREVILNYESEDFTWVTLEEMQELPLNEPTLKLKHEINSRKTEFAPWIK